MSKRIVPFRMHPSGWFLFIFCVLIGIRIGGSHYGPIIGLMLIGSLLLHELGHMLIAVILHVPVREFGLTFAGAYNRRAYATRRRDELLISIAGPLTNLALVFPLMFVPHVGSLVAACNLMLGAVNLLPIPSSDGLRILRMIRHTGTPVDIAFGLNASRTPSV